MTLTQILQVRAICRALLALALLVVAVAIAELAWTSHPHPGSSFERIVCALLIGSFWYLMVRAMKRAQ